MATTYFVVADVHGFYDEMVKALNEAGYDRENPDHCLVSCGDLLDRGSKPRECMEYVLSAPRHICIRGNHEDLMEQAIALREFRYHDITNGTQNTACAITGTYDPSSACLLMRSDKLYNKYISETIDYYETKRYIFVHGWIPCDRLFLPNHRTFLRYSYTPNPQWRAASNDEWCKARWYNGMEAWFCNVQEPEKTIVCGHWHCSWGNHFIHQDGEEFPDLKSEDPAKLFANFEPFVDDGIIALDTCTAYTNRVNVVVLEEEDDEGHNYYDSCHTGSTRGGGTNYRADNDALLQPVRRHI